MQAETFWPNEILANIITRNTKPATSITFFVAKRFPKNRGIKIINSKLLHFRCYGNTRNKFYIFRELG